MGVTPKTFTGYNIKPDLEVGGVKYYLARDVVANRIATDRDRNNAPPAKVATLPGDLNPVAEKARLDKERADMQALKNAILLGEYLPMESATFIFGKVGGDISAVLETIPAKIKRRLPTLPASELDLIRLELARAQNMASEVTKLIDEYIADYNDGAIEEAQTRH